MKLSIDQFKCDFCISAILGKMGICHTSAEDEVDACFAKEQPLSTKPNTSQKPLIQIHSQ